MPPRKRVSAPANRVYKSSTPLPQAKFPEQKKRIKSYGKKSSNRIPKQETLTQMDFLRMNDFRDEEEETFSPYEDEIEKPKKKRRKTTADEPSKTPQYHTQTITQLDWSFSTAPEEDQDQEDTAREDLEENWKGDDTYNIPCSSQSFHLPSNPIRVKQPTKSPRPSPAKSSKLPNTVMGPPQTPHRNVTREIPSSQSPATPSSLHSRASTRRRSPLKEKSTNIPIPFNTNRKPQNSPYKPPPLEVKHTFETETDISQLTRILSTPTKRSSPAKSVRFTILDSIAEDSIVSPSIKKEQHSQYPPSQASFAGRKITEVLDSDAESDFGEEQPEEESIPQTGVPSEPMQDEEEQIQPETCYGDIGPETQFEAERLLSSPRPTSTAVDESQVEENSAEEIVEERTQYMESQRLSTQHFNTMAPRTADSDVFILMHPQQVTNIVSRTKDHDMRNWSLPPHVSRIWIFEAAPVSTLKYMAVISPGKRPGEIEDERGIGNADFNAKRGKTWMAYEILGLYELADPLPLSKLQANKWLMAPPPKFKRVPPAVLDALMANLKPPLFRRGDPEESELSSSSTDTQEATAQLISTIQQFTQLAVPLGPQSSQIDQAEDVADEEAIDSIHRDTPRNLYDSPYPSRATTVDLTQSQTPSRRNHSLPDIVWESPTRPVPSSTPLKLPTPRSDATEYQGPESLVPYSIASSQLLTKSQMLPDSLLDESIPSPPMYVQDSDEEDEL
jgi:hypothetical protein